MPVVSRSVWVGISSQTLVPLVRDLHSVALSCSLSVFRGTLAHPSLTVIATLFQCVRDSGRSFQPSAVGSYHFWLLCCRVLVFCEAASLCVTCDWEWLKTTLVTGATLWISSIAADAYIVLLAGRCQSAKWQVAVGYAWLADGARENGGGSLAYGLSACSAMSDCKVYRLDPGIS